MWIVIVWGLAVIGGLLGRCCYCCVTNWPSRLWHFATGDGHHRDVQLRFDQRHGSNGYFRCNFCFGYLYNLGVVFVLLSQNEAGWCVTLNAKNNTFYQSLLSISPRRDAWKSQAAVQSTYLPVVGPESRSPLACSSLALN